MNFKGATEREILRSIGSDRIDLQSTLNYCIQDLAEARQQHKEDKELIDVQYTELERQRQKIEQLNKVIIHIGVDKLLNNGDNK